MKIKLIDAGLSQQGLNVKESHQVIRVEHVLDDVYFVVKNEKGEEFSVSDSLVTGA